MKITPTSLACLMAASTLALAAEAQTPGAGPYFKEQDISESALIDALTPAEPTIRTRSIRIRPNSAAGAGDMAATAPAKNSEASLLITFETNSADLTERARAALDVVGRALASDRLAEFEFSVEGHADPRGSSDQNLRLSQLRAESVVNYLVAAHSLPRERLHAVGKGDRNLADPSNPAAEENRRVTIKTVVK
jgi:outer membrane protein OmpA-like peptidoglycan-associated protein